MIPDAALSAGETTALIELAEHAIARIVTLRLEPERESIASVERQHPPLARARGAFVTVFVDDALRGCLGELAPVHSLARVVARCAAHAASADPRFEPVAPAELPSMRFKISALTPPRPLPSIDQIVLGRHGLIMRQGSRLGVLLPEVPIQYGWDVPTFLLHLKRKAGIPESVPLDAVELLCFDSQVIDSRSHAGTPERGADP
jgi:AmmeMemoRadiSam system protein A